MILNGTLAKVPCCQCDTDAVVFTRVTPAGVRDYIMLNIEVRYNSINYGSSSSKKIQSQTVMHNEKFSANIKIELKVFKCQ